MGRVCVNDVRLIYPDISGITVFDSIKIASFDFKDSITVGALTRIANKEGSVVMQLHDNPASVINIRTKTATTVTFDLADGVKASKEDNVVKIETDNLTAFIASTNSSINIVGGEVRIGPGSGNVIFRAVPVNDAKESSFWFTMPGGNRMQAMMYIANFSERVVIS